MKSKMAKAELRQILIDNFSEELNGKKYIDISNMNLSGYIVDIDGMTADRIYQSNHKAKKIQQSFHEADYIYQSNHTAKRIKQCNHKAMEIRQGWHQANYISQDNHTCNNVYQDEIREVTLEELEKLVGFKFKIKKENNDD